MKKSLLYVIKDWVKNIDSNFPGEHFGISDKFLLSKVIREVALNFEKIKFQY